MRVIIAGGRTFNNYVLLKKKLDEILRNSHDVTIVSGGANGADKLGEKYSKDRDLKLEVYPAKWKLYGNSAGYKRNVEMAENADALVAFWDGQSKGTKHMIDIGSDKGLKTRVIKYHILAKQG